MTAHYRWSAWIGAAELPDTAPAKPAARETRISQSAVFSRPDRNLTDPTKRFACDHQILGRAAKADEDVVAVRIDNRRLPGEIGKNPGLLVLQPEFPRLCIVCIGCEDCQPDELFDRWIVGKQLPLPVNLVPVTAHAGPEAITYGTHGSERKARAKCSPA